MLYDVEMSEHSVICSFFMLESGFQFLKHYYNPSLHSHLQSSVAVELIGDCVLPVYSECKCHCSCILLC